MPPKKKYLVFFEIAKHLWCLSLLGIWAVAYKHVYIFQSKSETSLQIIKVLGIAYLSAAILALLSKVHSNRYQFNRFFWIICNWGAVAFVLTRILDLIFFHFSAGAEIVFVFYSMISGALIYLLIRALSRKPKRRPLALIAIGLTLSLFLITMGTRRLLSEQGSGYDMQGFLSFIYVENLSSDRDLNSVLDKMERSFHRVDEEQKEGAQELKELEEQRLVVDRMKVE